MLSLSLCLGRLYLSLCTVFSVCRILAPLYLGGSRPWRPGTALSASIPRAASIRPVANAPQSVPKLVYSHTSTSLGTNLMHKVRDSVRRRPAPSHGLRHLRPSMEPPPCGLSAAIAIGFLTFPYHFFFTIYTIE